MPTRRRTLLVTASALATASVAGCIDGRNSGSDDDPTTSPPGTGGTTTGTTRSPTPDPPETTTGTPTATPTPGPGGLVNGSFEDGLDGWTVGRDLPEDPNNSGDPVESRVETTTRMAADGDTALSLFLDGSADDGTLWVQQRIDRSLGDALSVSVYSDKASFNTVAQVAAYAGPDPEDGLEEVDFDRDNAADGHEGWKRFEYPIEGDGPGLVAVGTNVVWETGVTTLLDDVRIE